MTELQNKYKATRLDILNKRDKEIKDAQKPTFLSGGDGRVGFHTIEEGKNVFRLAPSHNEDDPFLEAKCVSWLPQEITYKEQGSEEEKTKVENRPLFNSRIHNNTPKDLTEEYINFCYKLVYEETQDDTTRKKKLAPITGYKTKEGKWVNGLRPTTVYVGYGWKANILKRVELYPVIKNRMSELNITEEADEPLAVNIFSDPIEGRSLIVFFNKSGEQGKKYSVSKGDVARPLSEEQLIEFDKQPTLKSLYRNCYTSETFDKVLWGLKHFDDQHGYHAFDCTEFLDIVREIATWFPEEEAKEEKEDGAEGVYEEKLKSGSKKSNDDIEEAHVVNEKDDLPEEFNQKSNDETEDIEKNPPFDPDVKEKPIVEEKKVEVKTEGKVLTSKEKADAFKKSLLTK